MSPIRPENKALYPENWKEIRAEVMERAGGRCECTGECGAQCQERCLAYHGERRGLRPVTLTLAHLDHDPRNNGEPGDRPNLKAMCEGCHNRYDAPVRAANRRRRLNREAGQLEMPC